MDTQVQHALEQGGVIDITTRGRKTGQPRRIEIRFHTIEGQVYITGRPPRRRDWYANLLVHPAFTFHLKESLQVDMPARATPILDPGIHVKRDSEVSVRYAEELNSSQSSVLLQRADRHEILGQKPPGFQLSL